MRKFSIVILILFLCCTGCASYISNLTAPKSNLTVNQTAFFDSNDQRFMVKIDRVNISSPSPDIHRMTVHITVKNSGNRVFSLVAYPRLDDASGKQYSGTTVFLNSLNPDGQSSGESSITIHSNEDFAALGKSAILSVRFQGGAGKVWEANWNVDVNELH